MTMTVTLRMSDKDSRVIRDYAKLYGMTVSEFMRRAAMEKIEDEIDLEVALRAQADYEADPTAYSHDDVGRMLGLK